MWRVVPAGPALSSALRPPSHRAINVKVPEFTVEWTGRYSADKTLALFTYAASSNSLRIAAWLLFAPLVALVCPLLLEFLPLDDPFAGWRSNDKFLLRTMLRISMVSFLIDCQTDLYVPEQRLPRAALLVMNSIQGGSASAGIVLVATITGAFPVPFTSSTLGPWYVSFAWITRFIFVRLLLPVETDPTRIQRIKRRLPRVMQLVTLNIFMLFVYNLFAAVFTQAGEKYQMAMVLVLQLVKLAMTWHQWQLSHIDKEDIGDDSCASGDLGAAHVVSGARFFHALFTSTCLQKSKSVVTLAIIISVSLIQDTMMLYALHNREKSLRRATDALVRARRKSHPSVSSRTPMHEELISIAERVRSGPRLVATHPKPNGLASQNQGTDADSSPNAPEMAFYDSATRLLHFQEAVLLRLYVGIFVPLVYITYVALVQHSPNIQYLPAFQLSDSKSLATLCRRMAIPVVVKVATFLIMIRRHCREPGGLSQLAFAISSMHVVVLGNSVLNTLCVFDFALLHNGHDFTFQFKWLRGQV